LLIQKRKIPLVPRRPSSQDGKDAKKPKKPSKTEEASPPPPEDPDEKLIHDAYRASTNHVTQIVTSEVSLMSVDDTAKEEPAAAPADAKDAKGGKAKKSGSPSAGKKGKEAPPAKAKSPKGGKKGGKGEVVEAAPASATVELSDEDKAKKELKDKMKKEYLAALKKEGQLVSGVGIVLKWLLILNCNLQKASLECESIS
jgi:hypothetical protein